jgi:hypothetical protein
VTTNRLGIGGTLWGRAFHAARPPSVAATAVNTTAAAASVGHDGRRAIGAAAEGDAAGSCSSSRK